MNAGTHFNWLSLLAGTLGGFTIIALFIWFLFFMGNDIFNYKIMIINPGGIEKIENYSNKAKLLKEMEKEGIILTPEEYTQHVVDYYNTSITILATMLLVFTILGYLHLKFLSQQQITDETMRLLTENIRVKETIKTAIFGEADEKFAYTEDFIGLNVEVKGIQTELEILREKITPDLEFDLNNSEEENDGNKG